jgi:hypothetical protein
MAWAARHGTGHCMPRLRAPARVQRGRA